MLVYVLNKRGETLMPCSPCKARKLLKNKKAKILKKEPFTIQLIYGSSGYKQKVILGIDTGSKIIGFSATTQSKVLFEANVELRNDITNLLSGRYTIRRARRSRKIRYREKRVLNRKSSKQPGWLAPSIKQKIHTHLHVLNKINSILPISNIIIEIASFDIQKIKNPNIRGIEYQQGEQKGFWNVREYVLYRDNHECQYCHGKSGDKRLNVHHLESRKTGGSAPNNLITLCETCHNNYHNGKIQLEKKRGQSFRDATFMNILKWNFYNKVKEIYKNVSLTYGYITKNTRINNKLPKEHYIDARCISGNPTAKSYGEYYYIKKIRCHNRQLHRMMTRKGGVRRNNQVSRYMFGYQLFDKVRFEDKLYYIIGRRKNGLFDIRKLDNVKIKGGTVSYKRLKLFKKRRNYLIERRETRKIKYEQ